MHRQAALLAAEAGGMDKQQSGHDTAANDAFSSGTWLVLLSF
jgi:hypothetical protein